MKKTPNNKFIDKYVLTYQKVPEIKVKDFIIDVIYLFLIISVGILLLM